MDFHNLCQRLDVDSLRAKLPPLPQLKIPKSLPKIRGRKIFRSSRENVNNSKVVMEGGDGRAGATTSNNTITSSSSLNLPQQQQSQQFINRTPQRISTISSLMHEQQERMGPTSTYCSAGSLDDDYYAPDQYNNSRDGTLGRPISPVKMPTNHHQTNEDNIDSQNRLSLLTQRLQRGYKSLSELRFKHLFAKQTIVRRDNIEVDRYVEQYEKELKSEAKAQAKRDREIADNYDIRIKTLSKYRQNTLDEGDEDEEMDTPPPTIKQRRSVAEHSGDESGMEEEATPPAARRKPINSGGIAATRFAKVRQPPLQMPVNESLETSSPPGRPAAAAAAAPPPPPPPVSRSSYKQLLQKFPTSLPSLPTLNKSKEKRESTPENGSEPSKLTLRLPSKSKTNVEDSSQPADGVPSKLDLRQNIKRLRKSIKRPLKLTTRTSSAAQESGDEDQTNARTSVTLKNRLSRSTDQLQQRWRKSFKFSTETDQSEGAESSTGNGAYLERTFNKLNEKMHQLKFFQRQTNVGVASPPSRQGPKPNTVGHEPIEIDDEELAATYHHSDSEDDDEDDSGQDVCAEEAFGQVEDTSARNKPKTDTQFISTNASANPKREMAKLAQLQAKRSSTAWSSESLEEIPDEDYPRVLIHQEHSDSFESTLIIAVATAPPPIPPPPIKAVVATPTDWIPNEQIIAGFKDQVWPAPALYKPKSIDIFEASVGGAAGAFADFDEALRNAPVLRIINNNPEDVVEEDEAEEKNDEEDEEEEEEEEDDSSSGLTRIRVHSLSPQIGNSRESLMEAQQEEEDENINDKEVMDHIRKMSREKPSHPDAERPPSTSPPPPPLPQRRPIQVPIIPPVPIYDAVPPPLPTSRPPLPPVAAITTAAAVTVLPQRSVSMSRPTKPLVKTSSLRLTYNEQVRPGDVGKVNKLISRFEGGRPRLCPRRLHSEEYTNNNNNNDVDNDAAAKDDDDNTETDLTRTPTNRTPIPEIVTSQSDGIAIAMQMSSTQIQLLNLDRQNSNCSRSEYGSPLAYPSSRRSSTPTVMGAKSALSKLSPPPPPSGAAAGPTQATTAAHLRQMRRSRRSMTRDDDNFYSFDSDEENSYYSISPSGSSRYVVEI